MIEQLNQKGFTLIEVMIAIVILSIGILGAAQMQLVSVRGNSDASGESEAVSIGQERMEALLAMDFDDPVLNDTDGNGTDQDLNGNGTDDDDEGAPVDGITNFGLDDPVNNDGVLMVTGSTNIQYRISWNIAIDKPAVFSKHIKLFVQWTQNGRLRTLSFDRIKADLPGPGVNI